MSPADPRWGGEGDAPDGAAVQVGQERAQSRYVLWPGEVNRPREPVPCPGAPRDEQSVIAQRGPSAHAHDCPIVVHGFEQPRVQLGPVVCDDLPERKAVRH